MFANYGKMCVFAYLIQCNFQQNNKMQMKATSWMSFMCSFFTTWLQTIQIAYIHFNHTKWAKLNHNQTFFMVCFYKNVFSHVTWYDHIILRNSVIQHLVWLNYGKHPRWQMCHHWMSYYHTNNNNKKKCEQNNIFPNVYHIYNAQLNLPMVLNDIFNV